VWDERRGALFWLDIHGKLLHRHEPSGAADVAVDIGVTAGAIALSDDGARLITAVPDGFAWCDALTGSLECIAVVEHATPGRFNDGACDPAGRFLAGTTTEARVPGAAALYRLDPDAAVARLRGGLTIANGLDWSPDGRLLYHVDTPTGTIRAFDYDRDAGLLDEGRIVVTLAPEHGAPDGIAVDSDGAIWVALWDGAAVHRYAPWGELLVVLPMPTPRPTSVAFGGADLSTLYVTSARTWQDGDESLGGALFAVAAPVAGRQPHRYAPG
jgi:sugar lactone lactonase YvrE